MGSEKSIVCVCVLFSGQHWLQYSDQILKFCPVFWSTSTYNIFKCAKFALIVLKNTQCYLIIQLNNWQVCVY